ncbi:CRISPR-associated helicase Cas3' [Varibaculum cambriense]|uniref:CRISPR-associated helicase Cas3' n=1 Tax=Varibaculum cambriense TaxID=184870 RepID=UPI0015E096B4|nr:CRISPR-associated helicase Cas3' [Varibaculum cambriense]
MESEFPLSKAALSIWAKTNFWHSAPPDGVNKQWLPLAVHMADSGEVAELIWDNYLSQRQRQLLEDPLLQVKTIEEPSRKVLILLKLIVGAHDIGKCSPMFLTQNNELYERVLKHSLTRCERAEEMRGSSPHSWIGEIAFEKWVEARWNHGNPDKKYVSATAKQLGSIIGAHHGRPVSLRRHDDMTNPHLPLAVNGDNTWKKIRRELLDWWMNWTDSQEIIHQCKRLVFPTTWQSLVAGITVMADWIASNQDLFPLVDWDDLYPERLLSPERHRQRTENAWSKLHLPPSWQPEILSQDPDQLLQTLFSLGSDAHARPAQVAAVEAAEKMSVPGMMIIEEAMGAGKTEAALMAATILAKRAGTSGVLVALPTRATTDAMFTRVVEWAESSAKSGFSLKLQHGNAALNSAYKKIQYGRIASAGNAVYPGNSSAMGIDEESAHSRQPAVVHRWFNKKAALLASVVVCTVDHLLFSALQIKHVSLRHLGISDKVVIIDEVHSYDVYTSQFLNRTVQWLGAFGVPVIALSATLTRRAREELFAAYKKGQELKQVAQEKDKGSAIFDGSVFAAMRKPQSERGRGSAPSRESESESTPQKTVYPVLSYSDAQGVKVRPLPVLATKKIEVEHWEDDTGLLADLEKRLENGGCALVVRNTVANAQRTYKTLRGVFGEDVRLVHSRFTQQDRQDNDEWLVRTFGKPGKSRRPKRAIVVGTQVVEQSLDLDFDVLYSDLAPIDLLLQRIGRVHRHERGARPLPVAQPRCILMGVPSKDDLEPRVDRGSTFVYDEDVLLRTAAYVLYKEGTGEVWQIPTDIGKAVAAVYEETVATPDSWVKALQQTKKNKVDKAHSKTEGAAMGLLAPPSNSDTASLIGWLGGDNPDGDPDEVGIVGVRDGDAGVEVLLVEQQGEGIAAIPTDSHPESREIDLQELPSGALRERLVRSLVSIPSTQLWVKGRGNEEVIDGLIRELEKRTRDLGVNWEKDFTLRGQLVVPMQNGEYRTEFGKTISYRRDIGLQLFDTNSGI